jgi:hypothetical protein
MEEPRYLGAEGVADLPDSLRQPCGEYGHFAIAELLVEPFRAAGGVDVGVALDDRGLLGYGALVSTNFRVTAPDLSSRAKRPSPLRISTASRQAGFRISNRRPAARELYATDREYGKVHERRAR